MDAHERDEAPGRFFSYSGEDSTDTEAVGYVELRPHEYGGPFWDDQGCIGDDWSLWQSLGLSRETYDACLRWTGDADEKRRLLTRMRNELPAHIAVEAPSV